MPFASDFHGSLWLFSRLKPTILGECLTPLPSDACLNWVFSWSSPLWIAQFQFDWILITVFFKIRNFELTSKIKTSQRSWPRVAPFHIISLNDDSMKRPLISPSVMSRSYLRYGIVFQLLQKPLTIKGSSTSIRLNDPMGALILNQISTSFGILMQRFQRVTCRSQLPASSSEAKVYYPTFL